jgi:nitrite reductase/ring-hydroxylating ferredoxin subunit
MKRFLALLLLPLLFACDDSGFNNNNPYIGNYTFTVDLNLSLPSYSSLTIPGNGVYVGGYGERGLIVFYTGSGYQAYDAACPNQDISSCSTLQIQGITAICSCDDAEYNLYTGQAPGMHYQMKPYRVQVLQGYLRIYN